MAAKVHVTSLVTCDGGVIVALSDNTVSFWDATATKCQEVFDVRGHLLARSEHTLYVASGSDIHVVDLRDRTKINTLHHKEPVAHLALNGEVLHTVDDAGTVHRWEEEAATFVCGGASPCLAFSGEYVFTGARTFVVRICEGEIRNFEGHAANVTALAMGDEILFSGAEERRIICWNIESGEVLRSWQHHWGPTTCLERWGDYIVSGSTDHTFGVLHLTEISRLTVVGSPVHALAVGVDGTVYLGSSEVKVDRVETDESWCSVM